MWPYKPISDQSLTGGGRGGREKEDRDTGYLKGNPDSQFTQEIRHVPRYDP
jgi:hypothetical protein